MGRVEHSIQRRVVLSLTARMSESNARKRRTQAERREETRDKVERAAMTAVARLGFEGATIDAIARESGMSRGAVGAYFPAKEELWPVVIDRACRALEDDVARAFDESQGAGMNRVRAALAALLAIRSGEGAAQASWPELQRRAAREPALRERLAPALCRAEASLGSKARALADAAGLSLDGPPERAGRVILAVISAIAERARLDEAGESAPSEADRALVAQLTRSLFSV
jgi:AcrR family transcriptional regulator